MQIPAYLDGSSIVGARGALRAGLDAAADDAVGSGPLLNTLPRRAMSTFGCSWPPTRARPGPCSRRGRGRRCRYRSSEAGMANAG